MSNILRELRKKPPHERLKISVFTAAGLTALIVFIWYTGGFYKPVDDTKDESDELSPLSSIKSVLTDFAENIESTIATTTTKSISEDTATTSTTTADEVPPSASNEGESVL